VDRILRGEAVNQRSIARGTGLDERYISRFITVLLIRVPGGPLDGLLLQLLSVETVTPRNAAAATSRTYRISP
jgi:hypothetical protein